MLELFINPKRAERKPWQMFFIGLIYASLAVILPNLIFGKDPVLSQYLGVFVVTFCVIFTMPFVYYTIKLEERKNIEYEEETKLLKEHWKAISVFLWLFLGFVVAFSIWSMVLPNGTNIVNAQIKVYCQINQHSNFDNCLKQYGLSATGGVTGHVTAKERFFSIFANNVYVMIFTLILSLIFGAGAIFILAWNASVIVAAINIFTKSQLLQLPIGLGRYMIHGIPEIAAYFVAALAGGILSIAVIRRDLNKERFWGILQDSLNLLIIALVILFASAIIEVFITPKLF
jgi:uncharacterized membrane protein SpoIIM required for sporulation